MKKISIGTKIVLFAIALGLIGTKAAQAQIYSANGNQIYEYDPTDMSIVNSVNESDAFGSTYGAYSTALSTDGSTLYVGNTDNVNGGVGETTTISSYNAATLALENADVATFTSTLDQYNDPNSYGRPAQMVYQNGLLYVASGAYASGDVTSVNTLTGDTQDIINHTTSDTATGLGLYDSSLYVLTYSGVVETFSPLDGSLQNPEAEDVTDQYGFQDYGTEYEVISGNTLYVSDDTDNAVAVFNLLTGDKIGQINMYQPVAGDGIPGPGPITILGDVLYVTGNDGTGYAYNATTGAYLGDQYGFFGLGNTSSTTANLGTLNTLYGQNDADTTEYNGVSFASFTDPTSIISTPEPRSWLLGCLVLGALGLVWQRRNSAAGLMS
jgi:hypothetical protein